MDLSLQDWRDLLLIPLGIAGFVLLWWRSRSADRRATAALKQIELATDQLRTGQQDALDGRYQRIADMLGSDTVSTRVGGIFSLKNLMIVHPEEYHVSGMELLCAFIRTPPALRSSGANEDSGVLREDVQAAMSVIGSRTRERIKSERRAHFIIELEGVDLGGLKLNGADLSSARLCGAMLSNADLRNVNLSWAVLDRVDLTCARISASDLSSAFVQHARCDRVLFSACNFVGSHINGAKMTNACLDAVNFEHANTTGTDFSGSQFRPTQHIKWDRDGTKKEWDEHCRMVQRQLDEAMADPENVPKYDNAMVDAETSQPLVWDKERCGRRWLASARDL